MQWHWFRLKLVSTSSSLNYLILSKNSAISIYVFTVFNIVTSSGSNLRFPQFEYHFDSSDLYSVPKAEGGHIGYPTATHHASARAG
jgi:hypothetical protein